VTQPLFTPQRIDLATQAFFWMLALVASAFATLTFLA
jgi:hypothetical protein